VGHYLNQRDRLPPSFDQARRKERACAVIDVAAAAAADDEASR